jgi:putative Holliday junction resolvase
LPVEYQDERFTTVTAEAALLEGGVRRDKRRDIRDKVAAAVILQTYLDRKDLNGDGTGSSD